MKQKLKEDLRRLSAEIIASKELENIENLYETARGLYEKLAVLKFIDEKLSDIQVDVSKNVVAAKFEELANAVLFENKSVPESNPHNEDIITPGIDTIKDMVSEMPKTEQTNDEVLADFLGAPNVMKNDMEYFQPAKKEQEKPKVVSLNDKLVKDLKIGLNDRLAFVKHLFDGNDDDYRRVISQLATIGTFERSMSFINNMVKPEYNNWLGKEEYVERFIAIIEHKFV